MTLDCQALKSGYPLLYCTNIRVTYCLLRATPGRNIILIYIVIVSKYRHAHPEFCSFRFLFSSIRACIICIHMYPACEAPYMTRTRSARDRSINMIDTTHTACHDDLRRPPRPHSCLIHIYITISFICAAHRLYIA